MIDNKKRYFIFSGKDNNAVYYHTGELILYNNKQDAEEDCIPYFKDIVCEYKGD